MNSSTARPLAVIFQPPFSRSIWPCEKMSSSGTRAASRLVRSAQSRPLVARIANVALQIGHRGEAVRVLTRIFRTVT